MLIDITKTYFAISNRWKRHYQLVPSLRNDKFKFCSGEINPENNMRQSLLIARYLLFILTSLFYLAGPPASPITIKMAVVFTMLVATILAQNLYDNWNDISLVPDNSSESWAAFGCMPAQKDNNVFLWRLIVVETIGVALLILPTGGLDSPFVWYALNPIIAAVVYLPGFCCWGVLGLFLGAAIGASKVYPGFSGSIFSFLFRHMSVLLVFFLSTSLAQVAVSLYQRLRAAYSQLALAHKATEHSLEHISSLYQALEAFSDREDGAQLADVLAAYTSKLCEGPAACFLKSNIEEEVLGSNGAVLRIANQNGWDAGIDWPKEMCRLWDEVKPNEDIVVRLINKEKDCLIAVPIASHEEYFGLLAYLQSAPAAPQYEERKPTLTFLAELGAIILERLKTDKLWGRLLVSEEQNRIANEIHDGVAQYLFSMVCALNAISQEDANLQEERIHKQLKLVEDTANRASRELRASIYKLSPHKRGESIFVDNLASYLDDLGRLNGVQVDLQAEGSEEVLSPALRKGLYRIVREASSNAVRHGKCSSLKVGLSMSPGCTVLEIKDNGCGYEVAGADPDGSGKTGLGTRNMNQLAVRFNGDLEIQSTPGHGTLVRCTFPKKHKAKENLKEAVSE